jgi:hypothetical protein
LRGFLVDALRDRRPEDPRAIDIHLMNLSHVEVDTEEYFIERGRGDIVIKCYDNQPKLLCIIENKVWSGEEPDQTDRYLEAGRQIKQEIGFECDTYVFLTPFGLEPVAQRFISYDYGRLIKVLARCLCETEGIPEAAKELIQQFIRNVQEEIGMSELEPRIREICGKIYVHHKEAVDKLTQCTQGLLPFFDLLYRCLEKERSDFLVYYERDGITLSPRHWRMISKRYSHLNYYIHAAGNCVEFRLWSSADTNVLDMENLWETVERVFGNLDEGRKRDLQKGNKQDKYGPFNLIVEKTGISIPEEPSQWEAAVDKAKERFLGFLNDFSIDKLENVHGVR